jgi:hypothetical protein
MGTGFNWGEGKIPSPQPHIRLLRTVLLRLVEWVLLAFPIHPRPRGPRRRAIVAPASIRSAALHFGVQLAQVGEDLERPASTLVQSVSHHE